MDNVHGKGKDQDAQPLKYLPPEAAKLAPLTPTPDMPPLAPKRVSGSSAQDIIQPTKAPLTDVREPKTLNDEALRLLADSSIKARRDCFDLIKSLSNRPLNDDDDILAGQIEIVDNRKANVPIIAELAKSVSEDIEGMQKVVGDIAAPTFADARNQKSWEQTKNQTGAAAYNAHDIVTDAGKLVAGNGSIDQLKEDAVSAYQAITEAQDGLAVLYPHSRADRNQFRAQVPTQDMSRPLPSINPLSTINLAIRDLVQAKHSLETASHTERKPIMSASSLGRVAGSAALSMGNPAALALPIGMAIFKGLKALKDNNKVDDLSLLYAHNEITASVEGFHDADDQCLKFLGNESVKTDAPQQMKVVHEELTQVMPKLNDLYKMTDGKNWKAIDPRVTDLVTDLVNDANIQDLARQSSVRLDQY